MCGIIGIASPSPIVARELLVTQRDTLSHRGPDDAGVWWSNDGCVGLAHRRLAIIDLSVTGHQPMEDVSRKLCITFNGEIYNYRDLRRELETCGHQFHSASDTEVILESYRAWGTDCLQHFNGMYAFGLYDAEKQSLFLARDRAGEKPLFYWHIPGKFVFASELKALMADPAFPRRLDLESLEYYLAYGYVPGNKCILRGVNKLTSAQAALYELETDVLRVWRYWRLPEPNPDFHASSDELAIELEKLLEDSVRRQMVADVPVGILLSGGIDSSLVTAMAARVSSAPVKTFTISFPGHGIYDESPYARLIADYFSTEHTQMVAEPATVELLPELARQYDEPIADSSMVPTYLVSHLIRQHAKVALGGDGGDELFGGYPHYSWIQWQERVRHWLPGPLRRGVGKTATRLLPVGLRGRNYIIGFAADLPQSIAHINLFFDYWTRRQLLAPLEGQSPNIMPEAYRSELCLSEHPLVWQATSVDFKTTMVDDFLVKVDRASMLSSLEVRAPWLDYLLIEFAFSQVPDCLKATNCERKILPRQLAALLLPSELDLKRKQGFSIPLGSWFKGEWGLYMEAVLREADSSLFDLSVIDRLLGGQRRGYANTNRLFSLTIFELWRREYRIGI